MRIALFPPRVYNNGIKEREVLHMTYLAYIVVFSLLALDSIRLSAKVLTKLNYKFLTFPPSDGIIHWCQRVWRNWQTRQI